MLHKHLSNTINFKFETNPQLASSRSAQSPPQMKSNEIQSKVTNSQKESIAGSNKASLSNSSLSASIGVSASHTQTNFLQKQSLAESTQIVGGLTSSSLHNAKSASLEKSQNKNESLSSSQCINNSSQRNSNFSSLVSSQGYFNFSTKAPSQSQSIKGHQYSGFSLPKYSAPLRIQHRYSEAATNGNSIGKQSAEITPSTLPSSCSQIPQNSFNILHTPQPSKPQHSQGNQTYSVQKVAMNLNSKQEFFEPKPISQQSTSSDEKFAKQEYEQKIKQLEDKVQLLLSELDKQTNLSNSVLQDNNLFRMKYQELKEASLKQSPVGKNSGIEYPKIQLMETEEENKKLKSQLTLQIQEAEQWRKKYEDLDKQFEVHEESVTSKLTQKFQKEINSLHSELSSYKICNKSKKALSFKNQGNNIDSAFKENNINTQFNSNNIGEDWHSNYLSLKEEKERNEKALKRKIEGLEEQNGFLQNEAREKDQQNVPMSQQKAQKAQNIKELSSYFSNNLS